MPENRSALTIDAPPRQVWDALTQAEKVKQWQFGSDLLTTWEVGQPIEFRTEWQGSVFRQWGTVLEVRPYDYLRYSLFAPRPGLEDVPENYFVMHYRLREENGRTYLEIMQEDHRPNAVQEAPQGEESPVLQLLKKVAEAP